MEFKEEPIEKYYDIGDEIGSGQFAVVRRCCHRQSGVAYAAKFVRKRRARVSRRGTLRDDIVREVAVLSALSHPNVVQLHEVFEGQRDIVLVLELVSGGELFEYLTQCEKVTEAECVVFLRQILDGLRTLHTNNIAHLDLKPENLMLLDRESSQIKIIDFGLSRRFSPDTECREMLGTAEFVAPEIINYDPLSLATDMWSIGVISYILLSGCSPFLGDSKQETFAKVSAVDYVFPESSFQNTSDLATDFIRKLLVRRPAHRMTVDQCLLHPWIQPVELNHIESRRQSFINLENLKPFVAQRHWKNSVRIVRLCNRLKRGLPLKPSAAPIVKEEDEENFVMIALFAATQDGNMTGVEELLETANSFNVNYTNKNGESALHMAASGGYLHIVKYLHSKEIDLNIMDKNGDTAAYCAARYGHLEILQYLHEHGAKMDYRNKSLETTLHVASRYGHVDVIDFLCQTGSVDVNLQDKFSETALHTSAWHGQSARIVDLLCQYGCSVDAYNQDDETALHCAASRGHAQCVKVILGHHANVNLVDKRKCTPIHVACKRGHVTIAMMLLQAGCSMDAKDQLNETPLHAACKEGLYPTVQTMCALGCQVDVTNRTGWSPLHQAARAGHTEVVRCLLLSGADPQLPNKDGMSAEIVALAQGHTDIAEILTKLKPDRREAFMRQLQPTKQPLGRIKLKLFGHAGAGKTALANSLKCGYLGSFFRKSRSSATGGGQQNNNKGEGGLSRWTSLGYGGGDAPHEGYTQGIDIQQVNIAGAGDFSVWEFASYEPYYLLYDHCIGDPNCLHLVAFNVSLPRDRQVAHVVFWLEFIRARIAPMEPIGHRGRHPWPAKVIIVATHSDLVTDDETLHADVAAVQDVVSTRFSMHFDLSPTIFVLNAHVAMSPEIKALRSHLGQVKAEVVQKLPHANGLLDAAVAAMPLWRRVTAYYPVVSWPSFIEYVRKRVNLVASEEHLKELMCQLQLVGEVIYIEATSQQDLVVLDPRWLCSDVIGQLLSHSHLEQCRPTGCFTVDDVQLMGLGGGETDAEELLRLLAALDVCVRCEDAEGEVEYEFPCLDFIETLPGLWDRGRGGGGVTVYGGRRVAQWGAAEGGAGVGLLGHVFCRVQSQLRREAIRAGAEDGDLYQWRGGSKFCSGAMECLMTLAPDGQSVELRCRGPRSEQVALYYFLDDLCAAVDDVVADALPGLAVQRYVLSGTDLREHRGRPRCYAGADVLQASLTRGPLGSDELETFADAACFGCDDIAMALTPGGELHASAVGLHVRRALAALLDTPDPLGNDWCLLGVALGRDADLPRVAAASDTDSRTDALLDAWARADAGATVWRLVEAVGRLGRDDATRLLTEHAPLFRLQDEASDSQDGQTPTAASTYFSSDNTLSSNASR